MSGSGVDGDGSTPSSPSSSGDAADGTDSNVSADVQQGSAATVVNECRAQDHPWDGPGTSHSTAKVVVTLLSVALGCAVVYLGGETAAPGQLWSRAKAAVAAKHPGYGTVSATTLGNIAVAVWAIVDLAFRVAPVAHEDGPVGSRLHALVLRPSVWLAMVGAAVGVTAVVAVFAVKDRKTLRPPTVHAPRQLTNVLPTSLSSESDASAAVQGGLATSTGAWLALGAGRLVASPLLLPAAFLLLAPWVCTHQINFASSPSDAYVTGDCGEGGECFTFWHWGVLAITAAALATLLHTYRKAFVPASASAYFGMPAFLLLTVPTRIVLAWAATVLPFFSVVWSLAAVLVCNAVLTVCALLYTKSAASARISGWATTVYVVAQVAALLGSAVGVLTLPSSTSQAPTAMATSVLLAIIIVFIGYALLYSSVSSAADAAKVVPLPPSAGAASGAGAGAGAGAAAAAATVASSGSDVAVGAITDAAGNAIVMVADATDKHNDAVADAVAGAVTQLDDDTAGMANDVAVTVAFAAGGGDAPRHDVVLAVPDAVVECGAGDYGHGSRDYSDDDGSYTEGSVDGASYGDDGSYVDDDDDAAYPPYTTVSVRQQPLVDDAYVNQVPEVAALDATLAQGPASFLKDGGDADFMRTGNITVMSQTAARTVSLSRTGQHTQRFEANKVRFSKVLPFELGGTTPPPPSSQQDMAISEILAATDSHVDPISDSPQDYLLEMSPSPLPAACMHSDDGSSVVSDGQGDELVAAMMRDIVDDKY